MEGWMEDYDSGPSHFEWDGKDPEQLAAARAVHDQTRAEAIEKIRTARGFMLTLVNMDDEKATVETICISAMLPAEIVVSMMQSSVENVAMLHFSHSEFLPEYAYPLLNAMASSVAKVLREHDGGER